MFEVNGKDYSFQTLFCDLGNEILKFTQFPGDSVESKLRENLQEFCRKLQNLEFA